MVTNPIKGLKEKGGSSLQAIKKYVAASYKVDAEKVAPFIKKYLKTAIVSGSLVQTKGKGAFGSFKLASASGKQITEKKLAFISEAKKPAVKRSASGDKSKSVAKKAPKAKKEKTAGAAKAMKSAVSGEKKSAVAKVKSPFKAKKSKTGPMKKPKAPKPKTAKGSAGLKTPKKAASLK